MANRFRLRWAAMLVVLVIGLALFWRSHLSTDLSEHGRLATSTNSGAVSVDAKHAPAKSNASNESAPVAALSPARSSPVVEATSAENIAVNEHAAAQGLQRPEVAAGQSVGGHVVWPDGRPAKNATVSAVPVSNQEDGDWRPRAELQFPTAADGSFKVSGIPAGLVTLVAYAIPESDEPPTQSASPTAAEPQSETKSPVSEFKWMAKLERIAPGSASPVLMLEPAFALTGRVVDDLGAPVQRFQVVALAAEIEYRPRSRLPYTVSGRFDHDDGSFTLEGLHADMWIVRINALDHQTSQEATVVVPDKLALGTLVTPRVARLRGEVRNFDGKPVANADVEIQFRGIESALYTGDLKYTHATSDSAGRFAFNAAPSGKYSLCATSAEYADGERLPLIVAPGQLLAGLTLTLRKGGRLTVEVLSSTGAKVAGREVSCSRLHTGVMPRQASTDAEGHCTFERLAPEVWEVEAYPSAEEAKAFAGENSDLDSIARFALKKSARVTIVDGEATHVILGAPPRAPVEVSGVIRRAGAVVAGMRVQANQCAESGGWQERIACSDSKGAYHLTVDQPGCYKFAVYSRDGDIVHWLDLDVPKAASFTFDFEVPTGSISGRILGPDGEPISQGWAILSMAREPAPQRSDVVSAVVRTDANGAYRFENLPGGVYNISGMYSQTEIGPPKQRLSRNYVHGVNLPDGKEVRDVTMQLSIGATVQGTVHGADGHPAADVQVIVFDASGALRDDLPVRTDEYGDYECSDLTAGNWSAFAERQYFESGRRAEVSGYSTVVELVAGARTQLDFDLRPGTVLSVEAVDRNGMAIPAAISVRDQQGREHNHACSGSDAPSEIGVLAPGQYTITATSHDGAKANSSITISDEATRTVRLTLGGG